MCGDSSLNASGFLASVLTIQYTMMNHPTKKNKKKNDNNNTIATLKKKQRTDRHTPDIKHSPSIFKKFNTSANATDASRKRKLSSLQEKFKAKLEGGKFRWLNEQLYTTTSDQAVKLFANQPELFDVYHKGFESQVEKWPQNPVDVIIKYLRKLPKPTIIGDFGCGTAKIARTLRDMKVHSFDLAKTNKYITVANSANVPLEKQSLDVAVFCLSLMGTDYQRFISEAHRVLKPHGTLIVAEVKSRFGNQGENSMESMLGGIEDFKNSLLNMGFVLKKSQTDSKMFVLFHFEKDQSGKQKSETTSSPALKACIYKRR